MYQDEQLQKDPLVIKSEIIESVKRYQNEWVKFGKLLKIVNEKKLFKIWGFKTLNEYAKEELNLDKTFVSKLRNVFEFVSLERPGIASGEVVDIPSLEIIHAMKNKLKHLKPEDQEELKDKVFDDFVDKKYIKNFFDDRRIDQEEKDEPASKPLIDKMKAIQKMIQKIDNLYIIKKIEGLVHEINDIVVEELGQDENQPVDN